MKKRVALRTAAILAAAVGWASQADAATSLGINFVGGGGGAATGASLTPGMTAGAAPQANWNNESGASSTMDQPLNFQDGTSSGATVGWSSNNTWSTGAVPASPTPDQLLNTGYLDDSPTGKAITVTVSSIPASISGSAYDAVLYIAGDTAGRGGTVAVNGTTFPGAYVDSGPFKGAYIEATQGADKTHGGTPGNFIHLTGLTGNSFSVTLTPTIGSPNRIPLDALQISTPVSIIIPEPATLGLLSIGALGLLPRRRRA